MDTPTKPGDALAQPTRARLFALLGELRRPAHTEELATRVGLHPNGVRIQLERLQDPGLVVCLERPALRRARSGASNGRVACGGSALRIVDGYGRLATSRCRGGCAPAASTRRGLCKPGRSPTTSARPSWPSRDDGGYLASGRTMYRLLAARHGSVRERRDQLTHPGYARPELLAERRGTCRSSNARRSGPACISARSSTWFSRYAVRWTSSAASARHSATALFAHSCDQQQIERGLLTAPGPSRSSGPTSASPRPTARDDPDIGSPALQVPKEIVPKLFANRVSTMVVLTFDKLAGPFRIGETGFEPAAARPQPGSNR
jgi:hypothetical protein